MMHCISATSSCAAWQTTSGIPAETDVLKKGLMILLHVDRVSAMINAKMEVFKRSKARGIAVITFHTIVKFHINHAHNGFSQVVPLLGGTICLPRSPFTNGPIKQKK